MLSNFKKIAQVNITHDYYKIGDTIDLFFTPNLDTKNIMKRYGILFKNIQNGFQLYTNTTQDLDQYLNYISTNSGISEFGIRMTTQNPDLYLFTNLPLDWDGTIRYSTANTSNDNQLNPSFSNANSNADFGMITLEFDNIIQQNTQEYSILYATRKTQWNYYIVNNSNVQLAAPFIQTKNDIDFEYIGEVSLPNQEKALLFSSGTNLIELHNYVSQKFSLADKSVKGKGEKSKVIITGLPNPLPDRIAQIVIKGQQELSSPMYVYI